MLKNSNSISNNQKTIGKSITFEGIGLHTGLKSKVTILPSPANTMGSSAHLDTSSSSSADTPPRPQLPPPSNSSPFYGFHTHVSTNLQDGR